MNKEGGEKGSLNKLSRGIIWKGIALVTKVNDTTNWAY